MKISIIILGLLAIMTVVYSINVERVRKFHRNFANCSQELRKDGSPTEAQILICALVKDGKILDANGLYIKEASLKAFEDGVSDLAKLKEAKSIMIKCYDEEVQRGTTGEEQTLKIAKCTLPALIFVDKIE